MEHRSADWPEGAGPGDPRPADGLESSRSDADQGASAASEDETIARPGTGEPRVDAALRLLDDLADMPVSEHAALYEQVHDQLSDVLGELDTGPGS